MIFPASYYLDVNRPYFPPELVSAEALAHIRPVANLLPPVSNVAIECRLQAGVDNVDFIPQFIRPGGSGAKLALYRPEDSIWATVGRFCRQWIQPETALQEKIHAIWLEFDMNGDETELPRPSIFIGFEGAGEAVYYQQIAEQAIEPLQEELLSAAFRQNLFTCFTALSRPANLFSIGLMLARGYDRARVCIGRMPKEKAVGYLQQIGWPGPMAEVEHVINAVSPLVDEYGLALDVGERVTPKLGLECYLYESNPQREGRWRHLIDYFVASGQCAPDKGDALLRWPGRHFHGVTPAEAMELRTAGDSLAPRLQNLMIRRLSHLKWVIEPGKPAETKAYLELSHNWYLFGGTEK